MMDATSTEPVQPRVLVFSSLFPSPGRPNAGLFVRERAFRVGQRLPLVVVAPVAWFPFQGLIRLFRRGYRTPAPYHEIQQGFSVYHPRFFSLPLLGRRWDGFLMALGSRTTLQRLRREFGFNLIDSHFAYPDGYAATLLGRWLGVPATITLRGTEVPLSLTNRRPLLLHALGLAARVFAVSDSLRQHAAGLGAESSKIRVVGNGVDTHRFQPVDRAEARARLGLPLDANVLISVGGLTERKGFHRVIECLSELAIEFPNLHYVIVGGASGEGDWGPRLRRQVSSLGLQRRVHFSGIVAPQELKVPLSAADVFVLATRNEGWANVFLEAMACGLPVVTTDVGGNREVVSRSELGIVVPFGEREALKGALGTALKRRWNREKIRMHARANDWDSRIDTLVGEFVLVANGRSSQVTRSPSREGN